MSWHRKVKSIYSISLVTISFIIWSTLSNWLFKSSVNYKLFLITIGIVFCTQYLNSKKLKKFLIVLVPLGVSIITSLVFFKGQSILTNTIFLLFMILVTYSLEDASVDYLQYKSDIIKSMIALVVIWLISFTLGVSFVNAMYRFHILYIIMIIILMRETRRYVYDVKSNTSMITNIVIGISVLTLSLDYGREVISRLFDVLMKLSSYILDIITRVLTMIFGGVIGTITEKLRELILKRKPYVPEPGISPDKFHKQPALTEYKGIELPPMVLLVLKILILFLILYIIYKFLSRFRRKTKKNDGFVEEKERIVRKRNRKNWVKDLFGKIFESGKTNREKILYTYKGFEKVTEDADIYKPYMTATQLKNVTKIKVDNFDNLEEMTRVYNEAKFSMHDMTAEQVEQVKKGHSNIKKQL